MSGFSSKWLALREPLDLAARNRDVETAFLAKVPGTSPRILDLASGVGSTVAALTNQLPSSASWLLTDHDPALVAAAAARWKGQAGGEVSCRRIDLAGALEELPFDAVQAVTTSAFLDLVSEGFLVRLVDCVVRAQKPFLASLTYDGRAAFEPPAEMDEALREVLNNDQRTDKGFGRALGPDAAGRAIDLFEARGYRVVQGWSDWLAGAGHDAFLDEFLDGWTRLGLRNGLPADALEAWHTKRIEQIRSGDLRAVVGHVDFAAFP